MLCSDNFMMSRKNNENEKNASLLLLYNRDKPINQYNVNDNPYYNALTLKTQSEWNCGISGIELKMNNNHKFESPSKHADINIIKSIQCLT